MMIIIDVGDNLPIDTAISLSCPIEFFTNKKSDNRTSNKRHS